MSDSENPYATSAMLVLEDANTDRPSPFVLSTIRVASIMVGSLTLAAASEITTSMLDSLTALEFYLVLGMGTIAATVFGIGTCFFLLQILRNPIPDDEFFGLSEQVVRDFDEVRNMS